MIRWRKADEIKLRNYVRKFNASITRESKKNPELADANILPEKMDYKSIRNNITTRKDYNNVIRRIDRWFRPGARDVITDESGIRMTRWIKKEVQYASMRITNRRKKVREGLRLGEKALKELHLDDITPKEKLQKIAERLKDYSENNNTDIENETQSWQNFVQSVLNRDYQAYDDKRNEEYYENYINSLYENFGVTNAAAIQNIIEENDINGYQLYIMGLRDDRVSISFVYSPEDEEQLTDFLLRGLPTLKRELIKKGVFDG